MLVPAKRDFDVLHVIYGTTDDDLERFLREHDVGLNIHNEPYPSFENRVLVYLAAGLLVLSEPLSPRHGLTPGVDYLEYETPEELVATLRLGRARAGRPRPDPPPRPADGGAVSRVAAVAAGARGPGRGSAGVRRALAVG